MYVIVKFIAAVTDVKALQRRVEVHQLQVNPLSVAACVVAVCAVHLNSARWHSLRLRHVPAWDGRLACAVSLFTPNNFNALLD